MADNLPITLIITSDTMHKRLNAPIRDRIQFSWTTQRQLNTVQRYFKSFVLLESVSVYLLSKKERTLLYAAD